MDLSVMISHASMDEKIGTAWQRLLKRVFPECKLRYSSDFTTLAYLRPRFHPLIYAKKHCQYLFETLALNNRSGIVCQTVRLLALQTMTSSALRT
jgi:hypothetical protein